MEGVFFTVWFSQGFTGCSDGTEHEEEKVFLEGFVGCSDGTEHEEEGRVFLEWFSDGPGRREEEKVLLEGFTGHSDGTEEGR